MRSEGEKMAKNIVICSDDAGQNGLKKTNVSRIFTTLDLSDVENQIACYDPGVGATTLILQRPFHAGSS